jgi:hypothetical protein
MGWTRSVTSAPLAARALGCGARDSDTELSVRLGTEKERLPSLGTDFGSAYLLIRLVFVSCSDVRGGRGASAALFATFGREFPFGVQRQLYRRCRSKDAPLPPRTERNPAIESPPPPRAPTALPDRSLVP